jgi:hypothetical protein
MSSVQTSNEYYGFQIKCKKLLEEDEIRFAGLINSMGKLVAGGFKKGVTPLEDDGERQKMYMELALRVSMRMEFDYCFGKVKYSASRREKVVMISFPINNTVLLVSTEPNVDIDRTSRKIMKLCGIHE